MNTKELAAKAVDAYSQAVGGYAINGQKIPPFDLMTERVRSGWMNAVNAIIEEIKKEVSETSYNDGYADGQSEGYIEGFSDGRESYYDSKEG